MTCRGLCTSARTKCRPSLSTFSNSPVQRFFTRGRSCPLRPGTTGNVWRHLGLSQPRRCGWRLVSGSRLELPLDGARGALPDSCGALVWAEPAGVTEPWLSTRITAALSDRRPGHVRSTVTLVVTCARAAGRQLGGWGGGLSRARSNPLTSPLGLGRPGLEGLPPPTVSKLQGERLPVSSTGTSFDRHLLPRPHTRTLSVSGPRPGAPRKSSLPQATNPLRATHE